MRWEPTWSNALIAIGLTHQSVLLPCKEAPEELTQAQ
jgi:hypothetical protein